MLLDVTIKRNRGLLEAAIDLHQSGAIPAGCQVIDLDAVAANANMIVDEAAKYNLSIFGMTKQNGHHPHMNRVLLNQGFDSLVAVEGLQAHRMHRYGFPLGHVGHLANIPRHDVKTIVAMTPDFITVYNFEAARRVSEAAGHLSRVQDVYVRVSNPGEIGPYDATLGGWTLDECVEGVRPLMDLPNIRLAGLTQHAVVHYTMESDPRKAQPTEGFFTMLRAKEMLEKEFGLESLRLNCAGNTNVVTIPMLAGYGATDIEPGMALTANAPWHAHADMPEIPGQVLISEVLNRWQGELVGVGGVFNYVWDPTPKDHLVGLVGKTLDEALEQRAEFRTGGVIDYHGIFGPPGVAGNIGDSIAVAYHPQAHAERGHNVTVAGIASGNPQVTGIYDASVNPVRRDHSPIPLAEAMETLESIDTMYPPRVLGGALTS